MLRTSHVSMPAPPLSLPGLSRWIARWGFLLVVGLAVLPLGCPDGTTTGDGDGDRDGDGGDGDGDGDTGDGDGDGDGDMGPDGEEIVPLTLDGESLCRVFSRGAQRYSNLLLLSAARCMPSDPYPPEEIDEGGLEQIILDACAPGTPDREHWDAVVARGKTQIDLTKLNGCHDAGHLARDGATTFEAQSNLVGLFYDEDDALQPDRPEACQNIFTPLATEGEECVSLLECPAATPCSLDLTSHTSKCQAPAGPGDACDTGSFFPPLNRNCADGLDCSVNICEPLVAENGDCSAVNCADGLYCNFDAAPICRPRVGLGQSCAVDSCDDDLRCDADDICRPATVNEDGASCFDGASSCGAPCRVCRRTSPTSEKVCATRGGQGDTCDDGSDCQAGLSCFDEECGPQRGVGGACISELDCEPDLNCNAMVCENPAELGQDCEVGGCVDDLFCYRDACVADTMGSACVDDAECKDPEVCIGDEAAAEGVCGPRRDVGAMCEEHGDCVEAAYCADTVCASDKDGATACEDDAECKTGVCDAAGACAGDLVPASSGCFADKEAAGLFVFFGCVLGLRLRRRR